ncbi:gap junction gamma-3 protein isoform X3 [Rousettus aegyptiacus]|uniref:gap junction gamma-3 protein isoform X3 n=1 Tax=Rousettus aegyptiacus TaxID=9407 RepID=UPI00168D0A7C|nr:gap junction gamma-3 protein isoform X3 [Rousettus aegyptiacus]
MCGRFLRRLVVEESWHSTPVGRLLLPVLLGFRLLLLAASGTGVYGDEQSEFVCHTQQPGCKAACYDAFHPLSPLRFWAFQVILVAVPSALYMGFTMYHIIWHWEDSGKVKKEEENLILQREGTTGLGRWWWTWKQKSSNYFPTLESRRRHKEPTDNFPVVESKEQFRVAEL